MEEQQNNKRIVLGACFSIIASILLANTGLGTFIYTVPLVLTAYSFKETGKAVLVQLASVAVTLGFFVFGYRGLFQQSNIGFILCSGYLLLIPGLFCIVYTALRDFSSSVLRKVVIASIPGLVLGLVLITWLVSPSAEIPLAGIRATYGYMISQFSEMISVFDADELSASVVSVMLFITVPMAQICSVLPILLGETAIHKADDSWQSSFAFMKMPDCYAYVFIALVVSTVVSIAAKLPVALRVCCLNASLWLGLHYLLNGLSLYFFWRRKNNPYYYASRVVFAAILIALLPGIGVFIFFGLTVLGFLETWIEFR